MSRVIVAPSILSADFGHIQEEVAKVEAAGAAFIHLDVMDGAFVPNKTFGPELVETIKDSCGSMVKDTHLMVFNPHEVAKGFAEAGSDLITFHYEAYEDDASRLSCIQTILGLGCKVGMSIKPMTPPEVLVPFLPLLDLVLVMSVEPGKGGQSFMPESLQKLAFLRKEIQKCGKFVYLEVDGGINDKTAPLVVDAGADVLVAGSYLYGHDDYAERIRGLLAL